MVKDRYFVKIVPARGDAIHRLEITKRHIYGAIALVFAMLVGAFGLHLYQLHAAKSQVQALQSLTAAQQNQLTSIDAQTSALKSQLQAVQSQNTQIQRVMGIKVPKPAPQKSARQKLSRIEDRSGFSSQAVSVERKLDDLSRASNQTVAQAIAMQHLTMRILNLRHIEAITRERLIASIPSIDPVEGAPVVGCFCYRTSPDVGFHEGVDLGADYGETVRASAAGVVASADWDGGFGLKVDIDHGNGYHTWYAHLSKTQVTAGQHVMKGQPIGLVGSTGFSTGPHLHYQLMLNGTPIDPTPYLTGVPQRVLAALP